MAILTLNKGRLLVKKIHKSDFLYQMILKQSISENNEILMEFSFFLALSAFCFLFVFIVLVNVSEYWLNQDNNDDNEN